MKVMNVTQDQIQTAAARVPGIRLENFRAANKKGTAYAFTIKPIDKGKKALWKKIEPLSGRQIHAVNHFGHLRFFESLFGINPEVKIVSAVARFESMEDLSIKAMEIENKPVGSWGGYSWGVEDTCASDAFTGEPW